MNDEPKMPPRTGQGMDYGEQADVQQVHAAVQREKREPRAGAEPLSIWLIAIYGLAIFFGGAYLGRYSGNFIDGGLDPMGAPPAPKKAGRRSRRRLSKLNCRRAIGAKKFSLQIVRPAIKPMASAFPVNIHHWPVPNLRTAARGEWP